MTAPSAIVDANLLVLSIVGGLQPELVGRHRRLRQFVQRDISLLEAVLSKFRKFSTTPNILTEVSNLIGSGDQEICQGANEHLAAHIRSLDEVYIESRTAAVLPLFARLGLSDTVLLKLPRRSTVITADLPLANALQHLRLPCINFNHLRTPHR
jgi:hypothetical protein